MVCRQVEVNSAVLSPSVLFSEEEEEGEGESVLAYLE